jgi:predicted component of type VI protein secretion system
MRAALIGSGGPVLGREYTLDAPVVTIGRRDENTIVIKDPTVSRKHAEIRREGDEFVIADKGSTSGVVVNGQTISGEQPLRDGDRISIGTSAVFLVQLQPAEGRTISFSPAELAGEGKTQFLTRTELEDPRAVPAASPPPVAPVQPAAPPPAQPRPGDTLIGGPPESWSEPRFDAPAAAPPAAEAAPPPLFGSPSAAPAQESFSPPPAAPAPDLFAPPPSSGGFEPSRGNDFALPPQAPDAGVGQGWNAPQFNPPPSSAPPSFSAAPDVPRFGASEPAPPSFAPPPQPDQGGFAPPAPSFAPPPPPMGMPAPTGAPGGQMMAAPAAKSSRTGLVVGLVVLAVLVVIALIVAVLLLRGALGSS